MSHRPGAEKLRCVRSELRELHLTSHTPGHTGRWRGEELLIGQNLHLIRINTPSARSPVTPCMFCGRSLESNYQRPAGHMGKLEMQESLAICRHLTDRHHGAIILTPCNV